MLMFCLFACKKNNPAPANPVTYPNFSTLKVGNYWVYQEYSLDNLGDTTALGIYDSCYISKDTIINSQRYFILTGPTPIPRSAETGSQYLRDSLDYTIDNMGNIVCASRHFGTVLSTIILYADTIVAQMSDSGINITVAAGTYSTIDFQQTYEMTPQYAQNGSHRYRNTRYSQNIGIISETLEFYYGYPGMWERRLVRYHLN